MKFTDGRGSHGKLQNYEIITITNIYRKKSAKLGINKVE